MASFLEQYDYYIVEEYLWLLWNALFATKFSTLNPLTSFIQRFLSKNP